MKYLIYLYVTIDLSSFGLVWKIRFQSVFKVIYSQCTVLVACLVTYIASDWLGPVNIRTHTSARVVNRASRFHRSAGLEDIGFHSSSGRESPCNASASPSSSPGSITHT